MYPANQQRMHRDRLAWQDEIRRWQAQLGAWLADVEAWRTRFSAAPQALTEYAQALARRVSELEDAWRAINAQDGALTREAPGAAAQRLIRAAAEHVEQALRQDRHRFAQSELERRQRNYLEKSRQWAYAPVANGA